jgi:hypothetical protein
MRNADAGKIDLEKAKAAASRMSAGRGPAASAQSELSDEDKSKDAFFAQVAEVAEGMIARHGKEFAIGTLVLAAKFIAEDRPLVKGGTGSGEVASADRPG